MLDLKKLDIKIKLEIISLWLEFLKAKSSLSSYEIEAISVISDYILEEVRK